MTMYIADIASYQGDITLDELQAAGYSAINVKVSHGLGLKSVHPDVADYVFEARERGMALASFHWLNNSAPGGQQAEYAYAQLTSLGLDVNAAHVVDCEDNATEQIYKDYCETMRGLLGRDIVTYTGDWWWEPKHWEPRTPWLHSAPCAGYLAPGYPGDESGHWDGYGGWDELAIMQYRVAPVAGIDVSQSAVRSSDTWRAMTGENMATLAPCLVILRDEFNKLGPNRDTASDGWIGDAAHQGGSSDHNPDSKGVVHAIDVDESGPWLDGVTMMKCLDRLLERFRKNNDDPDNEPRSKYVIYESHIYEAPHWKKEPYSGSSNMHTEHMHISCEYDSEFANDTSPWGLLDLLEDLPMDQASFNKLMDGWAATGNGKKALASAAYSDSVQRYNEDGRIPEGGTEDPYMPVNYAVGYGVGTVERVERKLDTLTEMVEAFNPPDTPPAPARL